MHQIFADKIGAAIGQSGTGPLFVHSDVARAMKAVMPTPDRTELLRRHMDALTALAGGAPLWFPTFNYGYCRERRFDLGASPSAMGTLSEYARAAWASWRTPIPIFSVCGNGPAPAAGLSAVTHVFDGASIFGDLCRSGGRVLHYGSDFSRTTLIHHAEWLAGGAVYRFDKGFPGTVTLADGEIRSVDVIYPVWPMGPHGDYDWPRLERDLDQAGLLSHVQDGASRALAFGAEAVARFWAGRIAADPFYLLDAETRAWAEPMVQRLGRGILLADFETPS